MLCPNLATQGQFIDESDEGRAFAIDDCGGELWDFGANALPLQVFYFVNKLLIIKVA